MKDTWMKDKAFQRDPETCKYQKPILFYDAIKAIYGLQSSGSLPLLSVDSATLITDGDKIIN